MLLILILSCVCLTSIHAQTFSPPQCTHLYGAGSAEPYNATSIAAIYQRFCSVRQNISQCMETHKEYMLKSNNAVDWALALTFDKNHFDSKAQLLCQKLPEVATELECLTSHQNAMCVQILSASMPSVYQLYTNGNITKTIAKVTMCGLLNNTGGCYKRDLTTCSTRAKNFVSDYYEIFSGDCMGSLADMLPPNLKSSAFVSCAMDSFSDTINGIMQQITKQSQNTQNPASVDYIMEFVFSAAKEMCQKTGVFSSCIIERVKTTTNEIDQIILQFINVNKIKEAMDLQCSHMDDFSDLFKNSQSCLKAMTQQTTYCASLYMGSLLPQVPGGMMTTPPPNINSYANMICPGLKGMVDCMYLPLSRCKKGMDIMLDNMVTMLMSDSCKALADQGQPSINLNPQASVFLKCGMTMYSLFVEEGVIPTKSPLSQNQGPQTQGVEYGDMPMVIRKGMDVVCRNANWYLSCIDQRLPNSNNVIDKFFKEIIDFSDSVNRTKVISEVCNRNLADIKNSVDCFMSKFPENTNKQNAQNSQIIQCINQTNLSIWSVFANPQLMYNMNGQTIRSTFCTPIDGMINCARNSFGTCSATVGSLMNSLPKELLRTDCGGVRTTTPRPNTGKNNDPSAASDYKSNTVWMTIAILITALLTAWY